MIKNIILASKSKVRKKILEENKIACSVEPANIDEDLIKDSLLKEGASPEIVSKNLAELKANKISQKKNGKLVLGPGVPVADRRELRQIAQDPKLKKELKKLAKVKKPSVARRMLTKLPVVGRFITLVNIVMISKDAEASGGDPEAVKSIVNDAVSMIPGGGDVMGLGQIVAMLVFPEQKPYEPKPIMPAAVNAPPSKKAWAGSQHATHWKTGQY